MKSFLLSFILLIAVSSLNGAFAQTNLDTKAFVQKFKETPKAQLLDVRTPNEWNAGKIESSKCVNFMDADFKQQVEKLDKSKPVFVYCAAGGRSAKASKILKEAGFKEIYNLQGAGYADLAKEGIK
ncbi:rhodanese-like domain-containing protein [Runella aurantiaca]|uniref:Rhodanese-like domain-containing protein n=1 Tax=Runella aurantiaca TaxID=2282308 RepID=A0A369IHN5_9BACT|nr:rhodanese-like domain-containing protein [Runella aurantiaca]RDB06784.1 rhodanese-like domain-containing protein [Runella aurantiaca]